MNISLPEAGFQSPSKSATSQSRLTFLLEPNLGEGDLGGVGWVGGVDDYATDAVAWSWKHVHLNCGRCTKRCLQLLVVLLKTVF